MIADREPASPSASAANPSSSSRVPLLPLGVAVAAFAAALLMVAIFPAVEGLGDKVKLPVFHGAMTWVNLLAFSLMGVAAVAYSIARRDAVYRWEEALRWVAVPMWLVGSAMGFLAAMRTWDFTGSKSSRLEIVFADPRLMAQFWILLAGFTLLAAGTLVEDRRWLAVFDIGFVAAMWAVLLRAVLGPGRALHPDSPVLNSEELRIKAIFFGMVIFQAIAAIAVAWFVRSLRARS